MLDLVDCRVYRKFVSLTCLKSCTAFMQAKGPDGEKAQVHSLHRLKDVVKENHFKPVSHKVLSDQYQLARDAVSEASKFEAFMDGEVWPTEMRTSRENLLRSTRYDADIIENRGNDTDVLPALLNRYRQLYPALAKMKEAKYIANKVESLQAVQQTTEATQRKAKDDTEEAIETNITKPVLLEDGGGDTDHTVGEENAQKPSDCQTTEPTIIHGGTEGETPVSDAVGAQLTASIDEASVPIVTGSSSSHGNECNVSERIDNVGTSRQEEGVSDELLLKNLGMETYQMSWQLHAQDVWVDDSARVDAVICDPPYHVPSSSPKTAKGFENEVHEVEMKQLAQYSKLVIKSGGYVFVFTSNQYFEKWVRAFEENKFTVMQYPYTIVKDPNQIQRRVLNGFPQNIVEFAMVAQAPGPHPDGFRPDFDSPFHLINCDMKRRFSALYNVPVTSCKLTPAKSKSPFRTTEKSIALLTEILDMFVPEGGYVMDPYAGTLATAIACLQSKRKCISIEKDPACFREAYARLCRQAKGVTVYDDDETTGSSTRVDESERDTEMTSNVPNGVEERASMTTHAVKDDSTVEIVDERASMTTEALKESSVKNNSIDTKAIDTLSKRLPSSTKDVDNADSPAPTNSLEKVGVRCKDPPRTRASCKEGRVTEKVSSMKRVIPNTAAVAKNKRLKRAVGLVLPDGRHAISHLVSGCDVVLMCGDKSVGEAVCHKPPGGTDLFCRHLHGVDLCKSEKNNEYLIVIRSVVVKEEYGNKPYPYICPGPEESPNLLVDMYKAGMYIWDANNLRVNT